MTRALEVQLHRYQGQPYSEAALLERIAALPGRLEPLGDDWWLIGHIIDTIAGKDYEVRCRPPRIETREVTSGWVEPPPVVLMPETAHSRHLKTRLGPAN